MDIFFLAGYLVWLGIACWADTVVFRSGHRVYVQDFEILPDESLRLFVEGGEMTVPSDWVKKIVLENLTKRQVPMPTGLKLPYRSLILMYASRYGVDWRLIAAIVEQESGFNPWAVSPRGAIGLMQLLPSTGELFGANDLFDPAQNLRVGTAFFAYLLRRYHGNVEKALAAYNAGPIVVDRFDGIPPYWETRAYVQRVLERYDAWIRMTETGP